VNDFEKRLQDSLKSASADYRPSDPYLAKQKFMTRFRRRRIALYTGSVALAGAAAAAAIFLVPARLNDGVNRGRLPAATQLSGVLGTIDVGGRPTGLAFGHEVVWVANPGTGLVQRIGPLSNQVGRTYPVTQEPNDVVIGLGAAWIADESIGVVTKLPFGAQEGQPIQLGAPGRALDVATGAGSVWVVSNEGLFRIDPDTGQPTKVDLGLVGQSDVAAGQGTVVVATETELIRIDPASTTEYEVLAELEPSSDRDLQLSPGAVWVADGDAGFVTRYDLETGDRSEPVLAGGDFTAIAYGEDAIWIVSGNDSDTGNLTRIDPDTAEVLGPRVRIPGRPVDVTTGAGSVWIVSTESASVIKVDPNALPTD
jgi:streptogramin lyase